MTYDDHEYHDREDGGCGRHAPGCWCYAYRQAQLAEDLAKGDACGGQRVMLGEHQWLCDPWGEPDDAAFTVVTETTEHEGPRCTVCGFLFCIHCYRAGWKHPCPGPPPEGREFDWTGDGAGHPPLIPTL